MQVESGVEGAQNLLNLLYACHLGENVELTGPSNPMDYQDEVYYLHLASPKRVNSYTWHLVQYLKIVIYVASDFDRKNNAEGKHFVFSDILNSWQTIFVQDALLTPAFAHVH